MVDFLKQFPFVTVDEYKWGLSVPMIKIMVFDNSRVNYLTEKQAEKRKAKKVDTSDAKSLNDLGIPILK